MLSGKNKQRFEANYKPIILGDSDFSIIINLEEFYKLPLEMQKGVYEKYFDSLGKEIYIFRNPTRLWCYKINNGHIHTGFKTRLEAFTEAVKQLDKLINDEL